MGTHTTAMLQWMATNPSEGIGKEGEIMGLHCKLGGVFFWSLMMEMICLNVLNVYG